MQSIDNISMSNGKKPKQPLKKSFHSAFKGLKHGTEERNFIIHLFLGSLAIFISNLLNTTTLEKVIILIMIALVLGAELLNTAIEKSLDIITTDHHPEIGKVKELMSAMVLVFAIASVLVALLIFSKYIM
jgi:diacylglycerol kinase